MRELADAVVPALPEAIDGRPFGAQVATGVTFTVWRAADHLRMRWRNGGGTSHEVASLPADSGLTDFDWRISFAEVDSDGPFSTFPGVDRVIVLIDGERMVLTIDGRPHVLERHRPLAFRGESATTCRLAAGPTRDLNVMTRRGRTRAGVEVQTVPMAGGFAVDATEDVLLIALDGPLRVSSPNVEPVTLHDRDVLRSGDGPLTLAGPGTVAVVRFDHVR